MNPENIRKALLYFRPIDTYWKSTEGKTNFFENELKIAHYPQSIAPRIDQGHYQFFDEKGIPCKKTSDGKEYYNFTTVCSYALGSWEKYLEGGEIENREVVIKIADFLMEKKEVINDIALFLDYSASDPSLKIPCAMNQGEAISVLIRAHELTENKEYLDMALNASKAFEKSLDDMGVCGYLEKDNSVWYLESTKYILNGHNYAVMGLMELANYSGDQHIQKLYEDGVKSIEKALASFDTGIWSLYWLDAPEYYASIMYHNLHVVQLEILGKAFNSDLLLKYSKKFKKYGSNPIFRLRAALKLVSGKFNK